MTHITETGTETTITKYLLRTTEMRILRCITLRDRIGNICEIKMS